VGNENNCLERICWFCYLRLGKLFRKLKSHELSHKGHPNDDLSFTSKALITSAHVGGHDANPTNTISPSLEFVLYSFAIAFDEQYESIPDDEIALLVRKFREMHKFWKERRINSQNSNFSKRKKYDYSNKNDYNNKNDKRKKNCFRDKKKRNIKKIISQACVAMNDFDLSSEDSSSSEEDEEVNYKKKEGDFTGLCLMAKGVFHENKDLNLKLERSFVEIASLQSMHNDMSAQPCGNCNIIMVNSADLMIVHTQITSQLKGVKLELKLVPCF
jgi:hypothetical protein